MKKVTEIVAELAAPVAAEFGCELWDVESTFSTVRTSAVK